MLITTGSCCCGPAYKLYAGVNSVVAAKDVSGRLVELDPETGVLLRTLASFSGGIWGISCNPLTGNIYVIHDVFNTSTDTTSTVEGLDADGNSLWTVSFTTTLGIRGIAVSPSGFVYVGTLTGEIRKFDALTGTEVVSGGWPYTFGVDGPIPGSLASVYGICVDKSNNVYGAGFSRTSSGPPILGNRAVKLTPSAGVTWLSTVGFVVGESEALCVAINPANTELAIGTANFAAASPKTAHVLNSSTGAVTNEVLFASREEASAYNTLGQDYIAGSANGSGVEVAKLRSAYYSATGSVTVHGIVVGFDDNEFICIGGTQTVRSMIEGWVYADADSTSVCRAVEVSDGKVGAFS